MKTNEISRDRARELFALKGLKYSDISYADILRLAACIHDALSNKSDFDNSQIKMKLRKSIRYDKDSNGEMVLAELRVDCVHEKNRQAITFGSDEFIGFCGWADHWNNVPFVSAFVVWLDTLEPGESVGNNETDS